MLCGLKFHEFADEMCLAKWNHQIHHFYILLIKLLKAFCENRIAKILEAPAPKSCMSTVWYIYTTII